MGKVLSYFEPLKGVLGVTNHMLLVFGTSIVGVSLQMYLCYAHWYLIIFYIGWYFYDRDVSERGGRKMDFFQRLPFHRWCANYFPMKLHKTADIKTDQNYIFGVHPHGIASLSASVNFLSTATGVREKFPGMEFFLCTLDVNFQIIIRRELFLALGLISCSRKSIEYVLNQPKKGNAVVIIVGGTEEALEAHAGQHRVIIRNRKGFIREALITGSYLVPVYGFGENDLFNQVENPTGSLLRRLQTWCKATVKFCPRIFYGCSGFQKIYGILPYSRALDTVVGSPIKVEKNENPTREEIDKLHQKYMEELNTLFETHKQKYGLRKDEKLVMR